MKTKLTTLFLEFFESEQASGIILILCTITSLALANSPFGENFRDFWQIKIGFDLGGFHLKYDLEHWINDGLMAVFFLLIGLEIERELYIGELSDMKSASLPIIAAIGGMVTPALIYLLHNWGAETQNGFGIPMATDIAFALGILSLAGNRIPATLKIFLAALAIIDDLGAIIVIALFYSKDFSLIYLGLGLGIFLLLLAMNFSGVRRLPVYLIGGLVMWFLIFQSGIHAAIAGILLAFAIPFDQEQKSSLSYKLEHFLHKPVAFIIMPLFALANTGIVLKGISIEGLISLNTIGIFLGLLVGKPLGIILFSLLAIKLRLSQWPNGMFLNHLIGAGFLGGIGFTMAIFVTFLAFGDTEIAQYSKIAILLGSFLAGTIGYLILRGQPLNSQ
ncbi:MAG: Na+/H+ antiporter NhaA [Chloroflexi bacterium]|nr:Na+/H+ antiporter NhaA [Chloroflexota bacterium]